MLFDFLHFDLRKFSWRLILYDFVWECQEVMCEDDEDGARREEHRYEHLPHRIMDSSCSLKKCI